MTRYRCRAHLRSLVLMILAAPALASAQDDAFKRGLDARNDRKWAEAAAAMRSAIQADGQESTREVRRPGLGGRILGQSVQYLPHYFLGEALLNQGDCGGAVTAWATSEQQGVIKSHRDYYPLLLKGYGTCAAKGVLLPAEYNPLLDSTRRALTDVTAVATRITELAKANAGIWTANPELSQQYTVADGDLNTAHARLRAGESTRLRAHFVEARTAADRAMASLRRIVSRFEGEIENVRVTSRQATEVEQLIAAAESIDRDLTAFAPSLPAGLAESRKNGQDMITRSRERLEAGARSPNPAALAEARKYAQTAAAVLAPILDRAREIARETVKTRLAEATAVFNDVVVSFESSLTRLMALASERPQQVRPEMTAEAEALRTQLEQARRRVDRARAGENVDAIQLVTRQLAERRTALDTLLGAFGPITLRDRGVPAALEEAGRQFLRGEYQQVVATLAPSVVDANMPLALHAYLLRAASLYTLFVRGGEKDRSLLTSAQQDVERCKSLNAGFQPDPRVFGRRFITFFQSGAPAAQAAR